MNVFDICTILFDACYELSESVINLLLMDLGDFLYVVMINTLFQGASDEAVALLRSFSDSVSVVFQNETLLGTFFSFGVVLVIAGAIFIWFKTLIELPI